VSVGRRRATTVSTPDGPKRRHRPDYMLVVLSICLLIIGLVVIYSISPGLAVARNVSDNYYVNKQFMAIGLGIVTFGIMSVVPLEYWRRAKIPLIVGAALATVIALGTPISPDYPAHRWIRFAGLSFQSVELIKFAIIFVLGAFLVDRIRRQEINDMQKTLKPLLFVLLGLGIVVAKLQSDLGSTMVMMVMMAAMCYVAGLPLRKIALFGGIILIGGILAISTTAYRRDRLLTFLHPERDCQSTGYQACQALIAVGSGGVIGKGLGQSVQAYGYLPEAANDSIFAIYAEKFGFLGVAVLVGLFMALFTRLKNIMERAPDTYSRLVVAGVLAWLSTQAIINIGAMLGLLPLKGITLPFVSYGGTSIIFVTAAIGLVYNISRYTTFTVQEDGETERRSTITYRGNRGYGNAR
jgi:cell division protein FtsW